MEKIAKNVPTDPEKWARAKAQAKAKFDVYPSAYANGWAAKKYKEMGGGWKKEASLSVMEKVAMNYSAISAASQAAKPLPFNKPKRGALTRMGRKAKAFGINMSRRISGKASGPKPPKPHKHGLIGEAFDGAGRLADKGVKQFKQMPRNAQIATGVGAAALGAYGASKLLRKPKPQPQTQQPTVVVKTANDHALTMTDHNQTHETLAERIEKIAGRRSAAIGSAMGSFAPIPGGGALGAAIGADDGRRTQSAVGSALGNVAGGLVGRQLSKSPETQGLARLGGSALGAYLAHGRDEDDKPKRRSRKRPEGQKKEAGRTGAVIGAGVGSLAPVPFAPAIGASMGASKGRGVDTAIGAGVGQLAGGLAGYRLGKSHEAAGLGAIGGAMLGAYLGHGKDKKRRKKRTAEGQKKEAGRTAAALGAGLGSLPFGSLGGVGGAAVGADKGRGFDASVGAARGGIAGSALGYLASPDNPEAGAYMGNAAGSAIGAYLGHGPNKKKKKSEGQKKTASVLTDAFFSKLAAKLDPVGQEDNDMDNDGDHDSSDRYLMKRRTAITKAMAKRKSGKKEMDKEAASCGSTDQPEHKRVPGKAKKKKAPKAGY